MARLIDSSVFITLERRGRGLTDLSAHLLDEPAAVATISISELLVGVHRADRSERRIRREAFIETILETVPVLSFDLRSARAHAELVATLRSQGQPIGIHDLLIAASALAYGYSVLTDNLRDFQRIPGLTVNQPTWSD